MKWITFLLEYLYERVGDTNLRHVVGVPMATNCSTYLANLTLFMFEFEWFSQQISELKLWHLRKREQPMRLAFCTRCVDDLWNPLVNEAEFILVAAQIYLDWLPLREPEYQGQENNYLDMRIKHDGSKSE